MIEVVRYQEGKKKEWDEFVDNADNTSFMFFRDYLEYHSDRFEDHSLLLYYKKSLSVILPGNVYKNHFYSHQGLTFGGIIHKSKYGYGKAKLFMGAILQYFSKNHISNVLIKDQPFFYSESLQQINSFIIEHEYNPTIEYNIGAFIHLPNHQFPSKCVRKGKLEMYNCFYSDDFETYWKILESNLENLYKTKPVHTLKEILYLKQHFSKNIKLLMLEDKETKSIHAGAVLYIHKGIVKVQYFATTFDGRKNRASDVLYYYIINNFKTSHTFIDFGTNMDRSGNVNFTLLETKEKFGAKEFPVRIYSI